MSPSLPVNPLPPYTAQYPGSPLGGGSFGAAHGVSPAPKLAPGVVSASASSRHETTLLPVAQARVSLVRHAAAFPTPNGPRAVAHAPAALMSSAPERPSRSAQACRTVVMHVPRRLLMMHASTSLPIVRGVTGVVRHIIMLPVA